jgi:hypothetical protein
VEKGGRQEEEGHGAGGDREVIDPRVGGRPQPAHQEEHEEARHRVEDPGRRHARLPQDDEGPDPEEEEAEQRDVEVAGVPDTPAPELDVDLENAASGTHEIGHRVTDVVLVEDFLGVLLLCLEKGAVDTDDHIGRSDAREIGTGARNHRTHDPSSRDIGLQDDAVVRMRKEHVRNRQGGNEEGENPGRQRQRQTPLRSLHHHIIRCYDPSCSRQGRKKAVELSPMRRRECDFCLDQSANAGSSIGTPSSVSAASSSALRTR